MAMAIESLLAETGPSIDYDQGFRAVLEDHMTYLRNHPSTTAINVQPGEAYKYEADLFGLLTFLRIPRNLHYPTMRVNGYSSPLQAKSDIQILMIPSETVIGQIRQTHQTTHKLS
jgi:hypothetical protein